MKPETEIRNLKTELKELRLLCQFAGIPMLFCYMPKLVIKDLKSKELRKLNKSQKDWLVLRMKEFKKMIA